MSHSTNSDDDRPEPDIAKSGGWANPWSYHNVILWLLIVVLAVFLFFLEPTFGWVIVLALIGTVLLVFAALVAWFVVVKRGVLTWMRLALQPAKLRARGEVEAAEAVYVRALARARRFAPDDYRRGMMLCELATYVKNQGRSAESLALYQESEAILSRHAQKNPLDYFIALNNYGICFIYLKDFAEAQRLLEKALDLTLTVRKQQAGAMVALPLRTVQMIQFLLHLNLAVLFLELADLDEADRHLREVDELAPLVSGSLPVVLFDHYYAVRGLWELDAGNYSEAEQEVSHATNPNYSPCLGVRARLHLVRGEFDKAEQVFQHYWAENRKLGSLHRPDLLKATLEFAECLFGQGKHDAAFAALGDARSIVTDFALPADGPWLRRLETWLQRARDLARAETVTELERELHTLPPPSTNHITILDRLRVRPR